MQIIFLIPEPPESTAAAHLVIEAAVEAGGSGGQRLAERVGVLGVPLEAGLPVALPGRQRPQHPLGFRPVFGRGISNDQDGHGSILASNDEPEIHVEDWISGLSIHSCRQHDMTVSYARQKCDMVDLPYLEAVSLRGRTRTLSRPRL